MVLSEMRILFFQSSSLCTHVSREWSTSFQTQWMILSWKTLTSVTHSVLFTVWCNRGKERVKQGVKAVGRDQEKGKKSQVMGFSTNKRWSQRGQEKVRMVSRRESEVSVDSTVLISLKEIFF
jgi:hypothetical protein